MPHAPVERIAYSTQEAADAVGVSRATIYAWLNAGLLKSTKIAGTRRIPADELERVIQQGAA